MQGTSLTHSPTHLLTQSLTQSHENLEKSGNIDARTLKFGVQHKKNLKETGQRPSSRPTGLVFINMTLIMTRTRICC